MPDLIKLNCGNSYPVAGWSDDSSYVVSGSNIYDDAGAQDTSGVDCPENVLKDHRWASSGEDPLEYSIGGLSAYSSVDVTLYWSEIYYDASGLRLFDVDIQGVNKETSYDVWVQAGNADFTGVSETYTGIAPSSGAVTIEVFRGTAAPMLSGIKITGNNAPVCSITSPSDSATVSGTVTINATATDDGSVSGVEFFIDGVSIGTDSTPSGSTYSISWDTTGYSDGARSIKATATDGEGATTDDTILVTVDNGAGSGGDALVATFAIKVDWNNDGDFADTYDDVSADVLSLMGVNFYHGFQSNDDRVAGVGRASFYLKNSARNQHGEEYLYSPLNSGSSLASNLKPRRPVIIETTYDSTTIRQWTGYIVSITPVPRARAVRVECVDKIAALDNRIGSNLYTNKQAGYLISTILGGVFDSLTTHLDTGNLTFEYAGDKWEYAQKTAIGAIRDVVESEWGRFWMDQDGAANYWDTHHEFEDTTVDYTLSNLAVEAEPRAGGDQIYNRVRVEITPREVGASPIVGATLRDLPTLAPGESYDYEMRFRDPDTGESIAVISTVPLVNGTDYSPGGLGITLYSSATTCWGTITNNNSTTVPVTLFQVRVYPVYTYDTLIASAESTASQTAYTFGEAAVMNLRLALGDDLTFAELLAEYLVDRYSEPNNTLESITYANKTAASYADLLAVRVMDLLSLTESGLSLGGAQYRVLRVEQRLRGKEHRFIFLLEPYNKNNYALVGSAIVGTSTVAPL